MGNDTDSCGIEQSKINYLEGIKRILDNTDEKSTLILENGAGCGNEVSTQLAEFGSIRNNLDKKYRKRVKYCLDTCHMFAAGISFKEL